MKNLKKIICFLIIFLTISLSSFSSISDSTKNKSHLILNTGINFSNDIGFSKSHTVDNATFNSFNIGGTYSRYLENNVFGNFGFDYYRIGDFYWYYTGLNQNTTKTTVYVKTFKLSFSIQQNFADPRKKIIPFAKLGMSADKAIGEPIIQTEDPINNTDAFQNGSQVRQFL